MPDLWEKLLLAGIVLVVALALRIFLIFVIRRVVRALVSRPHERNDDLGAKARSILAKASGLTAERHRQRVETLGSLLRNVVDVLLVVVVLLTVLAIFGVPMGPLIASAGVGGVALGFGAQSLVKDYLSGIFMLRTSSASATSSRSATSPAPSRRSPCASPSCATRPAPSGTCATVRC